jgi:hypothetical protein
MTVAPLPLLVGGWSGTVVYLVSVSSNETQHVEHCILKLDRKGKSAKSDEVTRHHAVVSKSSPEFARDHIAELVFDRLEQEGAASIPVTLAPCSSNQKATKPDPQQRSRISSPGCTIAGRYGSIRSRLFVRAGTVNAVCRIHS